MSAYKRISDRLRGGGHVLLDGATGSELVRRGVRWRGHGLRTDAAVVQAVHEEYIAAGAEVIRTNTFQLNPRIYLNVYRDRDHMRHIGAPGVETRAQDLTRKAVEAARAAREARGSDVAIAGVMAPLEHCYRPDLAPAAGQAKAEHSEMAVIFADAGVDLLLLESMNTIAETRAATEAALATGLPVWVSFVTGPEGEILSGESLVEGVRTAESLGAEAVLVNCAPPEDVTSALSKMRSACEGVIGGLAQIGKFDPPSWKFEFHPRFSETDLWPPDRYAARAVGWREIGAQVIGGCCGTGPDHIRALKEVL